LILSIGTIFLMVYGIYPNYANTDHVLNKTTNILYQSTCRTVYGIALSYLIFACLTSNGGFINKILSWPVWVPLARLSYCTYLLHIYVLDYFYIMQVVPIHLNDLTIVIITFFYKIKPEPLINLVFNSF
jgi:peptidoglycan/LPS O-acetylase OafA/YrhL